MILLFCEIDIKNTIILSEAARSQKLFKINVLKIFALFTGKQLHCSPFLIKLHDFKPATLLKRDSNTVFFIEHLWWLLLHFTNLPNIYKDDLAEPMNFNENAVSLQMSPEAINNYLRCLEIKLQELLLWLLTKTE